MNNPFLTNWLRCTVFLLLLLLGTALDSIRAAGPEIQTGSCCARCQPREQDEVWLVNTRDLGCASGKDPSLQLARFDAGAKKWVDASLAELQAAPAMPLVVYVHGNRVEEWEALAIGWEAYCGLASRHGDAPFRFVIWSWPSAQAQAPLKDVRAKANRSDSEGWYLGWFLHQMPAEWPVGLVGFSFGGRIITGGLDALGGGVVGGQSLDLVVKKDSRTIRAVLMAPAVDACWICPGGCQDKAAAASDRLLVLYNPCDPALKRFRWTDKCSKPDALGYTGLICTVPLASGSAAEEMNVSGYIGKSHSSYAYLRSSTVMQTTREVVLP